MILLEAKNISKSFQGNKALDEVSFQLRPGTVHALMGENGAGKSTLVKCLMGIYVYDSGHLTVDGKTCHFTHPSQAINSGISMIEQELTPVDELTVAENIFLGREPRKNIILNYKKLNQDTDKMLASLNLDINATTKMKDLSLAQIQLVEIAKALSYESKIIIMDEPTSAIGEKEVNTLFKIIEKLKKEGKSIIYVSHRMEEIFQITDEITILRDGKFIDSFKTKSTTKQQVIESMVGRKVEDEFIKLNACTHEIVLSTRNFTKKNVIDHISIDLKKGEILGIFGLMGAGRSEFCDLLFGVRKKDSGELFINGRKVNIKSPRDAIKNNIAYITEDRKNSGLCLKANVRENLSLLILKEISKFGFLNLKEEKSRIYQMIEKFKIKTYGGEQLALSLSGGNQQKLVIGKWLLKYPKILILDEPTRGIDVGAKREIYEFISDYAAQGNSVILISSELPEVLNMSDRIAIFKDGKKKKELNRYEANLSNVMHYASTNC